MRCLDTLLKSGLLPELAAGMRYVSWGNVLGLDSALSEGMRIFVK